MRIRHVVGWGLAALALAAALVAEEAPRLEVDDRGRLILAGLPAVLADGEVERYLASGLTTSFVFQTREAGSRRSGAARIDVRFELWDEVFLVTVIDGGGGVEKPDPVPQAEFADWWAQARVALTLPGGPATTDRAPQARVSLDVIPFSQAELVDTQRWLAESMGRGRPGAGGGGVSRAVGTLIATSIQRRVARSWLWNAQIEEDSGQ